MKKSFTSVEAKSIETPSAKAFEYASQDNVVEIDGMPSSTLHHLLVPG